MSTENHHGEKALIPEDYVEVGYYDSGLSFMLDPSLSREEAKRLTLEFFRLRTALVEKSDSIYSPTGRCAHCGSWIRHHVIVEHHPSGAWIAIGETCATDRFSLDLSGWRARKAELDEMRARARAGERFIALRDEYPEAIALIEECLEDDAQASALMQESHRLWVEAGEPWEGIEEEGDGRYPELEAARQAYREFSQEIRGRWPEFVIDISRRVRAKGKISEKQAAAVVKYTPEHRERTAKWEAERIRRREEAAKSEWVGEKGERMDLSVRLLIAKIVDSDFGSSVLLKFADEDGNLFTSFSSGAAGWDLVESAPEGFFPIRGTVKTHTTYEGGKETQLTRVALPEGVPA